MKIECDIGSRRNQFRRIDRSVICSKISGQVAILGATGWRRGVAGAASPDTRAEKRGIVWNRRAFLVSLLVGPIRDAVFVSRTVGDVSDTDVVGHTGKFRS